ncbi:PrsW family intramembrane metalloprotease [bacterium]|nr:PrsW family intramembrane metalloprotease [bacterium]
MVGDIIIANVIASGFLILLIYFLDLNEKEPPWTLVRIYALSIVLTYFYGKVFALGMKPFEGPFGTWFTNFFLAGFCEEFWKLLIVLVFVWPLKSFNEESDGIIYYLIVAAGFTVLENAGYSFRFVLHPYLRGLKTGDMQSYHLALRNIVLIRWFSGHIFVNVVSGVFLGLAKKRNKLWLLVPGFLISMILHGFWNQMAIWGYLEIYALVFLIVNIGIFIWTVRRSMYYKLMRRLKWTVGSLIKEAREQNLDDDVQVFLQSIYSHIGAIGRLQSETLVQQAMLITETLPPKISGVPLEGENGLIRRFLKVYGILGRDRRATGGCFWFELFLKFVLTGFFLLTIIMRIMLAGG